MAGAKGKQVDPSDRGRSLGSEMTPKQSEDSFEQIAIVELALEKGRARAERAAAALRDLDADPYLIEAVERTQEELSTSARRLRQATYFAVPKAQTSIEAA